jgi:hypothetical protein
VELNYSIEKLSAKNSKYMEVAMEFIKPKNKGKVDWKISRHTRAIVEGYAKYAECSEEDVVDEFLKRNILKDEDFIKWLLSKRNNKRLLSSIFPTGIPDGRIEDEQCEE